MSRTDWGWETRTRTALIWTRECWCRTTGAWVWLRSPRDRWAWRWRCLRPLVSHVYRTLLQLRPTSRGCKPHSYNSSIQVPNIRWFSLGNKFLNYSRINFIIHIHVGSVSDPDPHGSVCFWPPESGSGSSKNMRIPIIYFIYLSINQLKWLV